LLKEKEPKRKKACGKHGKASQKQLGFPTFSTGPAAAMNTNDHFPLNTYKGWTRHQGKRREASLLERTGWSLTEAVSLSDHPVCARFGGFAIFY
jgi:hypothetical protein